MKQRRVAVMTRQRAPVEIDFLGMEKSGTSPGTISARGILQDGFFGLDTQLLRTFLNSRRAPAVAEASSFSRLSPSPAPVVGLTSSPSEKPRGASPEAAPLTIFYNGTVTVFDLPRHKAEAIISWAEKSNAGVQRDESGVSALALNGSQPQQQRGPSLFLDKLGEDIPLARKKSLHRFLEKRKERLTPAPLCTGSASSSSCEWEAEDGAGEEEKGKRRRVSSA